jgi:hypothetical protein
MSLLRILITFTCINITKVVLDCKIIYILLIIEKTTGMPHLKTDVLWWWYCGQPVLQRNVYDRILLITRNYAPMIRFLTWLDATAATIRQYVHYNNIQSTLVTNGSRVPGHRRGYGHRVKRQVFSTQCYVKILDKLPYLSAVILYARFGHWS